jgi:murein DD-endopeptidase MepM/ murein hydrolase activator NlpD
MTEAQAPVRSLTVERRVDRFEPTVDLGVEPAIEADGRRHSAEDRRNVSVRWLCGTILTGFAGALLIGSAIYASFGNHKNFAEIPEAAAPPRRDASGDGINPRKGDRLVKAVDIVAAKQTFKAPTTISVGDREVVRVRTFTRVATALTVTPTGFADDVPRFDPLKVMSDSRNAPTQEALDPGPLQDDAEVSFASRDINPAELPDSGPTLSEEEVEAQVNEHVRAAVAAGSRPILPIPAQMLLSRTTRVGALPAGGLGFPGMGANIIAAPFSAIEVRMVPENVTVEPRSPAGRKDEERLVVVRRNDAIEDILRANGATPEQTRAIVAALRSGRSQPLITEGQRIRLLLCDMTGSGEALQIARLSIYSDDQIDTTVALDDSGTYVQVAKAAPNTPAKKKPADDEDDDDDTGGMQLYESLYETALKSELPKPVIDDLVRIFANDVDFQRPVTGGDSFEAFYSEPDDNDGHVELLYASITARSETYKYYRFQAPDDQSLDFYDENGRSTRKFLVRKPIAIGETRSGFGMRRHPILGYSRMHTGVDWAAPIGTPIFAAGNGTVIKAGRESGYGNRVEIQHANGYITTYNHMSGFARGITEGVRVRQGQVVGYLGMTGLATGPHLHYEVIINGRFVDPMQVKLARTRELDSRMMSLFKRERDRIDGLIAKAPGAMQVAASKTDATAPAR